MSEIVNVSRRGFLRGVVGAGALVLGACHVPGLLRKRADSEGTTDADRATLHPNVFVGINADGTVYIVAHRSEMGTVIRTSLPLVVADELDADWKRVQIDQAIGDPRYGEQNTDGSHSVRSFFDTMRMCGATARWMLIQAAARQWNVPATECTTEPQRLVRHTDFSVGLLTPARYGTAEPSPLPLRQRLRRRPLQSCKSTQNEFALCVCYLISSGPR